MSGPDFEGVLAAHDDPTGWIDIPDSGLCYRCQCGDLSPAIDNHWVSEVDAEAGADWHRAHLSAALHADLARWLGDEGTREVVRQAVLDASPGTPTLTCERIATAALAALTTTDQEDR